MEKEKNREIFLGVLTLTLSLGIITCIHNNLFVLNKSEKHYEVSAFFNRSDGLTVNGAVRIAGVTVGKVVSQTLSENYQVKITLQIDTNIVLPEDSIAVIYSDSLLGQKCVEILPGGSERIISPSGEIHYTQGTIPIDGLLERILAYAKSKKRELPLKIPGLG